MRVSAAGGRPEPLSTPDAKNGEVLHAFPEHLPGGRAVLFTIKMQGDNGRIAVLDLKNHTFLVVLGLGLEGRYVPTGHLVYRRGRTLFAAPFDVKRLSVIGPETPVVEGLNSYTGGDGTTHYTFSHTGVLVFWSGDRPLWEPQATTLAWMDRKGVMQPLPEAPHLWTFLRLSPDGKRVATVMPSGPSASNSGSRRSIWVYDLDRATLTPLTFEGDDMSPVWTPDGRWITFNSNREGKVGIYRVLADGSGKPELLLETGTTAAPESWTPDGKTLLYTQLGQGNIHIRLLPLPGSGSESEARRLFPESSFVSECQLSRRTESGWLTLPTSPANMSFMCRRSRARDPSMLFRPRVGSVPAGRAMGGNSSIPNRFRGSLRGG
jgi:serine/threonine-protein kinase